MSTTQDLIRRGIAACQSGDKEMARIVLMQATEAEPNNQTAWLWMSGVVDTDDECATCLRRVIEINPRSDAAKHAMRGLEKLHAKAASTTKHLAQPTPRAAPIQRLSPPPSNGNDTIDALASQPTIRLDSYAPPHTPTHTNPTVITEGTTAAEDYSERYTIEQRPVVTMEHNVAVIEKAESEATSVYVMQYNSLDGSDDVDIAQKLFFVQQVGMRLKQVRIVLRGGEVILEAGVLHFMKGNITVTSPVGGLGGLAKKVASNVLTQETTFKPHYQGFGEIHLEPSFGHFIITYLDHEEMIVDKGMYYASEASVDVGVAMQRNVSSALFGGEGLFQTKLSGTGWCVLISPVPSSEIVRYSLHNEKLCVDGNFALLRKGNIDFKVEKSAKSIVGTFTSGEGVLQTFTGTGEVWLAPTQSMYDKIKYASIQDLMQTKRNRGKKRGTDYGEDS